MYCKNLYHISSSPAPDEWRKIPEIKDKYPKGFGFEKSLQKIDGLNICYWMICKDDGIWKPASDFFHVKLK